MKLPLYQLDAFTDRLFGGNPAAVVPLDRWLPDPLLQRIAAENNLSETAFFAPAADAGHDFRLRWFTPTSEVDLCGHATLATAAVLFRERGWSRPEVRFTSTGGSLVVRRDGDWLELDFPARPPQPLAPDRAVPAALGLAPDHPVALLGSRDLLVVLEDEATVRVLTPDFAAIATLDWFGVCVTAPGDGCDFVSRFFAPRQGIHEDPVTGSTHCTLTPYWAERLGRTSLEARQVSARGGALRCVLDGDRVRIAGATRCYLRGEIELDDTL